MYDPGIGKISENCIALHRNENLFIDARFQSDLIKEASTAFNLNTYPESNSYDLRKALAEKYQCTPEEIYIGNGADGVLADLFQHLRNDFNEMGLQPLTYQVYPYLCKRYEYQQKLLEETTQLWVVDSPNSINGDVFDFESINTKPKFTIWDNVYGDYDPVNKDPIFNKNDFVRVNSFSKFYGLASLRIGYCIGHPDFIANLLAKKDIYNVNSAAQQIALLALKNHDYYSSLASEMLKAKKALVNALNNLGFTVDKGNANFIRVLHPSLNMAEIEDQLRTQGILVRHFKTKELQNSLRIAVPPQDLGEKLIETLKIIIKRVSK